MPTDVSCTSNSLPTPGKRKTTAGEAVLPQRLQETNQSSAQGYRQSRDFVVDGRDASTVQSMSQL